MCVRLKQQEVAKQVYFLVTRSCRNQGLSPLLNDERD